MKLKDIATIRTGTPDIDADEGNEFHCLRMKSIDHAIASIKWDAVDSVKDGFRNVKRLKAGEILIVSKGERNTAVLFPEHDFPTIATNHFFILSLDPLQERFLPMFIVWYLNYPAKDDFNRKSTGSVIPVLRKEALENLEIPALSLAEQKLVVDIYVTMNEQKKAFDALFDDRMELLCQQYKPKR